MAASPAPALANSATALPDDARGRVVVCGSHGGVYAGWLLAHAGVRAGVLHDAGVGKDAAGTGALRAFPRLALATVSQPSARIGDAAHVQAVGIISHCNAPAAAVGVTAGMSCEDAVSRLQHALHDPVEVDAMEEARHVFSDDEMRIVCVDSASLVVAEDAGAIIMCGSHGGVVVGQRHLAIRAEARLAVYNDAGGGTGTGRLAVLDERTIAAATVAADTARIGDGRSTFNDGVLSAVNDSARRLGLAVGMRAREAAGRASGQTGGGQHE